MKRFTTTKWMLVVAIALMGILVLGACSSGKSTPAPNGGGAPPAGSTLSADDLARLGAASLAGHSQQQGIWVNGSGAITVKPDLGILSLAVEARADSVRTARGQAAIAMYAVLGSLQDNGIENRDIQTTSFRIQPITVYREVIGTNGRERTPEIIGYVVTNTVTAKVRDLDRIGEVIDDAAAAGGDEIRINSISLGVDDPKPLETEARELALRDAMAKAEQIAEVTGVTLGSPIYVSESSSTPIIARAEFAGAPALDNGTPISVGESQITVRVQVVFHIL